jgi:hypothetical protein
MKDSGSIPAFDPLSTAHAVVEFLDVESAACSDMNALGK